MKVTTNELQGAALDWAVAKCEGDDTLAVYFDERSGEPLCHDDWPDNQEFKPSTDWAQGGPIIEREWISVASDTSGVIEGFEWFATIDHILVDPEEAIGVRGPTPLIAAMRCYVACKLGDEVEIPFELVESIEIVEVRENAEANT
jgi:hypothetical protein